MCVCQVSAEIVTDPQTIGTYHVLQKEVETTSADASALLNLFPTTV